MVHETLWRVGMMTLPDHKQSRRAPAPTIARLSTYLQCLRALEKDGITTVSSADMARHTGINAAQFRKDLSYFGEFGRPGVGYQVGDLKEIIQGRMGLQHPHRVLLVGAGSLGSALCSYPGFVEQGFNIVAVFDNNPLKVGQRIGAREVLSINDIVEKNRALGARFGVIAAPKEAAQGIARRLVDAGVRCILNFAPVRLSVSAGDVVVRNVDLTQELEVLSYYLLQSASASDDGGYGHGSAGEARASSSGDTPE